MRKSKRKKILLKTSLLLFFVLFAVFSIIQINESNYNSIYTTSIKTSGADPSGTEVLDQGDFVDVYTDWLHPWLYISWSFYSSNNNVTITVMLLDAESCWDFIDGLNYSCEAILSENKISDSGNTFLQHYDTSYYVVFLNNDTSGTTSLTWNVAIKLNYLLFLPIILIVILVAFTITFSVLIKKYINRKRGENANKQYATMFSQKAQIIPSPRNTNTETKLIVPTPKQAQDQAVPSKKIAQKPQITPTHELENHGKIEPPITRCKFCGNKITSNMTYCLNCGVKVKRKN